ncbi:MAG: hypothetical protein AAF485_22365 [Chloroflexota bacterium]
MLQTYMNTIIYYLVRPLPAAVLVWLNTALWTLAAQQVDVYALIGTVTLALALSFFMIAAWGWLYSSNLRLAKENKQYEKDQRRLTREIERVRGIHNYRPLSVTGLHPPIDLLETMDQRFGESDVQDILFYFNLSDEWHVTDKKELIRKFLTYATQHHLVEDVRLWIQNHRPDIK